SARVRALTSQNPEEVAVVRFAAPHRRIHAGLLCAPVRLLDVHQIDVLHFESALFITLAAGSVALGAGRSDQYSQRTWPLAFGRLPVESVSLARRTHEPPGILCDA